MMVVVAAGASAAPKANLSGESGFGFPSGTEGGQLSGESDLAVNRTGVGGVAAGTVYVSELAGHRISQYTGDGVFVRMWGFDVIKATRADGVTAPPNSNGTGFEVCDVTDGNLASDCQAGVGGAAAGQLANPSGIAVDPSNGYLYVTSRGINFTTTGNRVDVFSPVGEFAGAFGYDVFGAGQGDPNPAGPDFCTTACQGSTDGSQAGQFSNLSGAKPAVDPNVSGRVFVPDNGNLRVSQYSVSIGSDGKLASVSFDKAFGSDVVATGPGNRTVHRDEQQQVTVRGVPDFSCFCLAPVTGGSFTLSFDPDAGGAAPAQTTAAIPYNASAPVLEQRLEDLAAIAPADVSVTGGPQSGAAPGPDTPWTVDFAGAYAGTNVAQMTINTSGLEPAGSIGDVTTTRAGGQFPDGLEVCVPADGDTCKVGVSGNQLGEFTNNPGLAAAVAGDGSVYVTSGPLSGLFSSCSAAAPCRVQKFAPDLASATEFGPASGIGTLTRTSGAGNTIAALNVAVDPSDDHVYVLRKGVADRAQPDQAPTPAVDKYQVVEFDSDGTYVETHPGGTLPGDQQVARIGLGVGTEDRLYTLYGSRGVFILGPVPPATSTMVSVADVDATSATFSGEVTIPPPGQPTFTTSYRFEYSANGVDWSRFPATDQAVGNGDEGTHPVTNRVTGLQPCTVYAARVMADTGGGAAPSTNTLGFTTDCVAPRVALTFAEDVTKTRALLGAHIDAEGSATTYHFEWGATPGYGNRVPAFERQLGSGNRALVAREQITGLQPATTYHFRVVASNAEGTATSPGDSFETLNDCGLTQGRCYELVSPPDKGPVGAAGDYSALGQEFGFQVAPDGDALQYVIAYGAEGATSGDEVPYIANRDAGGWASKQLAPPTLVADDMDAESAIAHRNKWMSRDLSCGVFMSAHPVTADAPRETLEMGGQHLFRRNADESWTTITSLVPLNAPGSDPSSAPAGGSGRGHFAVVGGSEAGAVDECERVVFRTRHRYPGIDGVGTERLYKWENGDLFNVGEIPGPSGPVPAGVVPGAINGLAEPAQPGQQAMSNAWNAVSDDGSRVFFSANSLVGDDAGQAAVFMRDGTAPAVDVSQSMTGQANDDDSVYQTAAADGSRVIFMARYGLAGNSVAASPTACASGDYQQPDGRGCALYSYSVGVDGTAGTADDSLTELSEPSGASPVNPSGPSVAGVLGASDDATRVYFAARGRLTAGEGNVEADNLAGGTANVYLSEGGVLSYVGEISVNGAAAEEFIAASFANFGPGTRVTPDGGHLLFETEQSNVEHDVDAVRDVYLYDAERRRVECVSCRRDLEPSPAIPSPDAAMLVNGPEHAGTNASHPPVTISDDGSRVFFRSFEGLAHGGIAGQRNIYEWHDGQLSFIASSNHGEDNVYKPRLAGTTSSGDDVFFATVDRMTWEDVDGKMDFYTARVGGGFAKPADPPAACDPLAPGACGGGGGSDAVPADPRTSSPTESDNASAQERKTLGLSRLSKRARRLAARRGVLAIRVRTNSPGRVRLTAKARLGKKVVQVGRRTVRVREAGAMTVKLRLSRKARMRLGSGKRLRVRVQVRQAGAHARAMSVLLPGAKS